MNEDIYRALSVTVDKLDGCDARWYRKKLEPPIESSVYGSGETTILLLHGLFGAMSNWDSIIPDLAKYATVHALKFPLLSAHRTEVTIKSLVLLTHHYILTHGLKNIIVCGNSLGGHVSIRLTLVCPDVVKALILSGSSGLYEHTVDYLPRRPNANFVKEQMSRVFYNQTFVTDEAVKEVVNILATFAMQINILQSAKSAKRDYLLDELKKIKCPTLLLWGQQDEVTTMKVANTFHANIAGSKLISIDKCGHAPMIEHPEWFAQQMKDFIGSL